MKAQTEEDIDYENYEQIEKEEERKKKKERRYKIGRMRK